MCFSGVCVCFSGVCVCVCAGTKREKLRELEWRNGDLKENKNGEREVSREVKK